jgi:hypothetical protein
MRRRRGIRHVLRILTFFTFPGSASAEACKGSTVPKAELRRDDARKAILPNEYVATLPPHLPMDQLAPDPALRRSPSLA